ncbi:LytTR family transcriptional regulator DNA-binding domain-containing protein [Roseospirillum parvum]|uniref:PAS domain S-box-containing protein n=1 Tax=Roseospirillum parvum TaxID=83401 RepID=A0A1G8ANS3_9PROT|nr:LytTR family transcriptional regulator DNA-binding domain-containing protein [Roseospirillum parvum]SDH22712.1 PAS domain S-box-containing protein [Roseospirillum parvum]
MEDFAYRLQRLEAGVVLLDAEARVAAVNPPAERLLGHDAATLIGRPISELHPPAARGKLDWLLKAAGEEAQTGLMVSLPGQVLVLKATRLAPAGVCLTLYPVAPHEAARGPMAPQETAPRNTTADSPPPLVKLPVSRGGAVALMALADVAYLRADGHYTAVAAVDGADGFCPRSLAELESRLDRAAFLRVHRSYMVNLGHATGVKRQSGRLMLVTSAARAPLVPVGRTRADLVRRLFAV